MRIGLLAARARRSPSGTSGSVVGQPGEGDAAPAEQPGERDDGRARHRLDAAERAGDDALAGVHLERRQHRHVDGRPSSGGSGASSTAWGRWTVRSSSVTSTGVARPQRDERGRLVAAVDDAWTSTAPVRCRNSRSADDGRVELPDRQDDVDLLVLGHARKVAPARSYVRPGGVPSGARRDNTWAMRVCSSRTTRATPRSSRRSSRASRPDGSTSRWSTASPPRATGCSPSGSDCVLLDLGLPDADGLGGARPGPHRRARHADRRAQRPPRRRARPARRARGRPGLPRQGRHHGRALARALRHGVERARIQAELAHQAMHDGLTGLPNRTLFYDRLRQALNRLGRTQTLPRGDVRRPRRLQGRSTTSTGTPRATRCSSSVGDRLRGLPARRRHRRAAGRRRVRDPVRGRRRAATRRGRSPGACSPTWRAGEPRRRAGGARGEDPDDVVRDADAAMYAAKRAAAARSSSAPAARHRRCSGGDQAEPASTSVSPAFHPSQPGSWLRCRRSRACRGT